MPAYVGDLIRESGLWAAYFPDLHLIIRGLTIDDVCLGTEAAVEAQIDRRDFSASVAIDCAEGKVYVSGLPDSAPLDRLVEKLKDQ